MKKYIYTATVSIDVGAPLRIEREYEFETSSMRFIFTRALPPHAVLLRSGSRRIYDAASAWNDIEETRASAL